MLLQNQNYVLYVVSKLGEKYCMCYIMSHNLSNRMLNNLCDSKTIVGKGILYDFVLNFIQQQQRFLYRFIKMLDL